MEVNPFEELIRYRIEQTRENLHQAAYLLNKSVLRDSMDRAASAMYFALLAVLATKQLGTTEHEAAIALFEEEFVKQGPFPEDLSQSIRQAYEHWQAHNGRQDVEVTRQVAQETYTGVRTFVGAVKHYLHSSGFLPLPRKGK